MHDTLVKQGDWTPTAKTLLERTTQVPEERLRQWQHGTTILRLKQLRLEGTPTENNPDTTHMVEKICESIRVRHKQLSQSTSPSKDATQTEHGTGGQPHPHTQSSHDSPSTADSDEVSRVTGLSSDACSLSAMALVDDNEELVPKLKRRQARNAPMAKVKALCGCG